MLLFCMNDFFVQFLVFEILVTFSNYCVQILHVFFLSVLGHFFFKNDVYLKRCTIVMNGVVNTEQ